MAKNISKKISCGFSLIEVLLVIAIIGVISVLSINTLQVEEQQVKARKIAAQIQQIFSAANAYYSKYDKWPDKDDAAADQEFRRNYFTWDIFNPACSVQADQEVCYKYNTLQDAGTKNQLRFQVIAEVTTGNKAKQVANMLPYALDFGDAGGGHVEAEIAVPTQLDSISSSYYLRRFIKKGDVTINDSDSRAPKFSQDDGIAAVSINNLSCVSKVASGLVMLVLPRWYQMGKLNAPVPEALSPSGEKIFANVPTPQIKTIGIEQNGINCTTDTCNFIYDFQGVLLDKLWLYDSGVVIPTMGFPRPLSGYHSFEIFYVYPEFSSGGTWRDGNVSLDYLVFCQ